MQRVELPHPGRPLAAGSGRRPGPANAPGPSCGSGVSGGWRAAAPFTRLHRWRAEPGSSPHCPSETP